VELVSRGEFSSTEGLAAAQTPNGGIARLCVAALSLDQTSEFVSQKCGDGEAAFRSQDARLAERFLVESQRDVPYRGHQEYV